MASDLIKRLSHDFNKSTREIITDAIDNTENEKKHFLQYNKSLERSVQRVRKQMLHSFETMVYDLPEQFIVFSNGEKFLQYDSGINDENRILIFGKTFNVLALMQSGIWNVDGTFQSCPNGFSQIYSIHGWHGTETIPALYILMKNKNISSYERLFSWLKTHEAGEFAPKSIVMDCEQAVILL